MEKESNDGSILQTIFQLVIFLCLCFWALYLQKTLPDNIKHGIERIIYISSLLPLLGLAIYEISNTISNNIKNFSTLSFGDNIIRFLGVIFICFGLAIFPFIASLGITVVLAPIPESIVFAYIKFESSIHNAGILEISIIAFVLLIISGATFLFRLKLRTLYGLTEVVAGLSIIIYRLTEQSTQEAIKIDFFIAIITAGIYLIVRGLDNMHQGWKDDKVIKPIIVAIKPISNRFSGTKR